MSKGALEGHAESELSLGNLLLDEGLYEQAKAYIKSAASKGCARAFIKLGYMYCGGLGVRQNLEKAKLMYTKGKEHGFSIDVEQELQKHAVRCEGTNLRHYEYSNLLLNCR